MTARRLCAKFVLFLLLIIAVPHSAAAQQPDTAEAQKSDLRKRAEARCKLAAERFVRDNDPVASRLEFEAVAAIDVTYPMPIFFLGTLAELEGKKSEAVSYYERFVKMDTTSDYFVKAELRLDELRKLNQSSTANSDATPMAHPLSSELGLSSETLVKEAEALIQAGTDFEAAGIKLEMAYRLVPSNERLGLAALMAYSSDEHGEFRPWQMANRIAASSDFEVANEAKNILVTWREKEAVPIEIENLYLEADIAARKGDFKTAIRLSEQAKNKGGKGWLLSEDREERCNRSWWQILDFDTSIDSRKAAFESIRELAEAGNANAMRRLSFLYKKGLLSLGVSPDVKLSQKWLACSVNSGVGDKYVKFDHGVILVEESATKAEGWYWIFQASTLTGDQTLVPDAVVFIKKAGEKGDAIATGYLGELHLFGSQDDAKTVPLDVNKGVELIRTSAENGSGRAKMILGQLSIQGAHGVPKNELQGFFLLNAAFETQLAKDDRALCAQSIGDCYREGVGVKVDLSKAAEWYRKSAEGGQKESMHQLAWQLLHGIGVAADQTEAVVWLRRAEALHHDASSVLRAILLLQGSNGDATNAVEAIKLLRSHSSIPGAIEELKWLDLSTAEDDGKMEAATMSAADYLGTWAADAGSMERYVVADAEAYAKNENLPGDIMLFVEQARNAVKYVRNVIELREDGICSMKVEYDSTAPEETRKLLKQIGWEPGSMDVQYRVCGNCLVFRYSSSMYKRSVGVVSSKITIVHPRPQGGSINVTFVR